MIHPTLGLDFNMKHIHLQTFATVGRLFNSVDAVPLLEHRLCLKTGFP